MLESRLHILRSSSTPGEPSSIVSTPFLFVSNLIGRGNQERDTGGRFRLRFVDFPIEHCPVAKRNCYVLDEEVVFLDPEEAEALLPIGWARFIRSCVVGPLSR